MRGEGRTRRRWDRQRVREVRSRENREKKKKRKKKTVRLHSLMMVCSSQFLLVRHRVGLKTSRAPHRDLRRSRRYLFQRHMDSGVALSHIHLSEPTRLGMISY